MTTIAWDAKLYDDKHAFVWEKATGVMQLLSPTAGERILDLGCGTGHLTSQIASAGANVIGIDRSPEMISKRATNFPSCTLKSPTRATCISSGNSTLCFQTPCCTGSPSPNW